MDLRYNSDSNLMWTGVTRNWRLYCAEALGLAIFMMSACFFSAMLEGDTSWHKAIIDPFARLVLTGLLMGTTAIVIFYLPVTAASGSHINPAVTITFLRLGMISRTDAVFYILFQFIGGTLAVYIMAFLIKQPLILPPVNYAVTVPMKSTAVVIITEFAIAVVMMMMILHTSHHRYLNKYTRILSGCFVCIYVIVAGPISGFGMNPARSFASALPADTWTSFWIYAIVPVVAMLFAAELHLHTTKLRIHATSGSKYEKLRKKRPINGT
jgi:aquaporin Z